MRRRTSGFAALVILCIGRPAHGQVPAPQAVAAELLAVDSNRDWRAILRIADPVAVAEFRNQHVMMVRALFNPDPRYQALMQRALDSAQSSMMSDMLIAQRARLLAVYQVPSFDSLAALPPDSVLARWYRGLEQRWGGTSPRYTIIGTLQPSDSIAYVVLDLDWSSSPLFTDRLEPSAASLRVLVVRKRGAEWRAALDVLPNPAAGIFAPTASDTLEQP